jgi:GNAT superfamily N-acetyltransferase
VRTAHTVVGLSPSPELTLVDGTRAGEHVAGALEKVRSILRDDGRSVGIWIVGPLSEPADLDVQLLELGLVLADGPAFEARGTAMALDSPPTIEVPCDVSASEVTETGEVRTALSIQLRCNGVSDDVVAQWLDPIVESFDPGTHSLFLAELDGQPVAAAAAVPTADGIWLTGAGTLPAARGRGAYRALVAARWAQAVERGTPAMVVQAGSMSRPVLERAGFQPVGELLYLRDEIT